MEETILAVTMNQPEFIGYLILALVTLGSFIAVIQRFTQPINELKVVIQELKDCIKEITKDNDTQNKRLDRHREEIEDLQRRTSKIETRIEMYHNHRNT